MGETQTPERPMRVVYNVDADRTYLTPIRGDDSRPARTDPDFTRFLPPIVSSRAEMEAFIGCSIEADICIITTHGFTNSMIDICSDSLDLINTATSWLQGWRDKSWKMGKNKKCNNIDLLERIWFLTSVQIPYSSLETCSFTPKETLQRIF